MDARDVLLIAKRAEELGGKAPRLGRRWVVVVGIDRYPAVLHGRLRIGPLFTAVADATEVEKLLLSEYGFEQLLPPLVNEEATPEGFKQLFRKMRDSNKISENDQVVMYYAGHGIEDAKGREGFWIPFLKDEKDYWDYNEWISHAQVKRNLQDCPARQVLLVSDSCYAQGLTEMRSAEYEAVESDVDAELVSLCSQVNVRAVLTSGSREPVLDGGGGGHSVFCNHFLDLLKKYPEGCLPMGDLAYGKLRFAVEESSKRLGMRQTPRLGYLTDDTLPFLLFRRVRDPEEQSRFKEFIELVESAIKSKEWSKAEQALDKARQIYPDDADLKFFQGKYRRAKNLRNFKDYIKIAIESIRTQQWEDAEEALDEAAKLYPYGAKLKTIERLKRIIKANEKESRRQREKKIEDLINEGKSFMEAWQWRKAAAVFNQVLTIDSNHQAAGSWVRTARKNIQNQQGLLNATDQVETIDDLKKVLSTLKEMASFGDSNQQEVLGKIKKLEQKLWLRQEEERKAYVELLRRQELERRQAEGEKKDREEEARRRRASEFDSHLTEAEKSLKLADFKSCETKLSLAVGLFPGHERLAAFKKRLDQFQNAYSRLLKDAEKSIEARRHADAGVAIEQAEKLCPEAPDISRLKEKLARAKQQALFDKKIRIFAIALLVLVLVVIGFLMFPGWEKPPLPGPTAKNLRSTVSPEVSMLQERIQPLMEKANRQFSANKLLSPANDNAYLTYKSVLVLDANNAEALKGMEKIAARYMELAERAMTDREFNRAVSYLNQAETVLPGSNSIAGMRRQLENVKTAYEKEKAVEEIKRSKFKALIDDARRAIESQQWEAAQKKIDDAKKLFPDHAELNSVNSEYKNAYPYIKVSGKNGRFKVSREGVILDTKTDLEWFVVPEYPMKWDAANELVSKLIVAGGGWRMPKVFELEALYISELEGGYYGGNFDAVFKLNDTITFGGVWSGEKWDTGHPPRAFCVSINGGGYRGEDRDHIQKVLAVRSRR